MTNEPSWDQIMVLLIQAADLITELLDVIDTAGIARPTSVQDRLDLLLTEASEVGALSAG